MKANVNRTDLRAAAVSGTVLTVNGHSLTVESINKTDSGKQRFTVCIDGKRYDNQYLKGVQSLLGIKVNATQCVIIPKTQKAKVTASNNGANVTVRYKRSGDTDSIRQLAYSRIDTLRAEQRRIEREVNLLLALTSEESFEQERKVLQARETAANGRKRDLQARASRLQSYIDTYAQRIGNTMLSGNIEKAQLLVATQAARLVRAQALIALLSK